MKAERKGKGSAKISGSGTIAGGTYETVKISGAGKVEGDLEAETVSISGAANVVGSVKAACMHTSGSSKVCGDVEAEEFHTSGAGKVEGNLRAERVRTSGSQSIGGNMKAKEIHISGGCRIGGDVEAELFKASGSFEIGGMLNAEQIEISLSGRARVREIGGTRVTVSTGNHRWRMRRFPRAGRLGLEADVIEADEIDLEATKAGVVRGQRVRIGPGCQIDTVEYGQSLEVDEGASVANRLRTAGAASEDKPAREDDPGAEA